MRERNFSPPCAQAASGPVRLLVTRPARAAQRTAERLRALGHCAVTAPALAIRFEDFVVPEGDYRALVLTSENGVEAVARHRAHAALKRLPAYVVGSRTARAASGAGFADVRVPPDPDDVVRLAGYIGSCEARGPMPLLHVSAAEPAGDLAAALKPFGLRVQRVTGYSAIAVGDLPQDVRSELEQGGFDAVLLYSPRSAKAFFTACGQKVLAPGGPAFLCLSAAVAAMVPVDVARARVRVADRPEESALFALIDTLEGARGRG